MAPNGDLLVFYWMPGQDWNAVNVSQITGQKLAGPVTSWVTPNGPVLVEHLAGMAPNGDLLVFYWMPGQDWNAVNVSQITGQKLAGPVTSWVAPSGPVLVEHLAGMAPNGDLLVFYWMPGRNWDTFNVSQITGQKIAGPVTGWTEPYYSCLAAQGPGNQLLLFTSRSTSEYWYMQWYNALSPSLWVVGAPTYSMIWEDICPSDSTPLSSVILLAAKSPSGDLLVTYRGDAGWDVMNFSDAAGHKILSVPQAWVVPNGNTKVLHLAAESDDHRLLVFYSSWEGWHPRPGPGPGPRPRPKPDPDQDKDYKDNKDYMDTKDPKESFDRGGGDDNGGAEAEARTARAAIGDVAPAAGTGQASGQLAKPATLLTRRPIV